MAQIPGVALNRRNRGSGPLDEELTVIELRGESGAVKGTLLHYACHAVVLGPENREISADFPGAACAQVEAATGAPCLYLQGPCGDINPVIHPGSFADVGAVGREVAEGSERAGRQPLANTALRVRSEMASFPLASLPSLESLMLCREEQVRQAREAESRGETVKGRNHRAMVSWAERTVQHYCSGLLCPHLEVPLQCIEIGDLLLVGVPGELFVEFGLEAKRLAEAVGKRALVVAYANGDVGYIPTAAAYAKGGYEVDSAYRYYGYPSPVAPAAGEAVSRFVRGCLGS